MKPAIIIPVYNEQDSIEKVIREWAPKGELILVNDGSKDRTREIIEGIDLPLTLINQENQGHGQSCINGYNYALEKGYEWIFQTDSDGQTVAGEFDTLWNNRESYSALFGRRLNRGDGVHRKVVSLVLKMVMCLFLGRYLKDPNVPFRLIRADILKRALEEIPQGIFLANAYLTAQVSKLTTIFWSPITFAPRDGGVPSINFIGFFKVGIRVIRELQSAFKSTFPLESITLLYLAFPMVLFLLGWLHLYISLPLTLILLLFIHRYSNWTVPTINWGLILSFGFILTWVYYSGAGAFSFQNGDYQKHHAMLFDLITQSWPVGYIRDYNLVYYLAHYLVPALFGKLISVQAAHTTFFIWTLAGVWLSLLWLFRLVGRSSTWITLFFIFFSGFDLLGQLIMDSNVISGFASHIEWWSGYKYWQYSSNTALLYWVPQHAVAGWLLTAMMIKSRLPKLFIFALSALWSPFVMLGLIPFLALRFDYKRILRWENGYALFLLAVMGLFYLSGIMKHRSYLLWTNSSISDWLPVLLLFYLLEFGLIAAIIFKESIKIDRKLFWVTLGVLLFIPHYIFGHYNDFAMRSSIPAIFVFQIFVAKYLIANGRLKKLLILLLIGGIPTGYFEIHRSIVNSPRSFYKHRSIPNIQDFVAAQYMGSSKSFFFKYLARKAPKEIFVPGKVRRWLGSPQ